MPEWYKMSSGFLTFYPKFAPHLFPLPFSLPPTLPSSRPLGFISPDPAWLGSSQPSETFLLGSFYPPAPSSSPSKYSSVNVQNTSIITAYSRLLKAKWMRRIPPKELEGWGSASGPICWRPTTWQWDTLEPEEGQQYWQAGLPALLIIAPEGQDNLQHPQSSWTGFSLQKDLPLEVTRSWRSTGHWDGKAFYEIQSTRPVAGQYTLHNGSISTTWEPARTANSSAHPRPTESHTLTWGPALCILRSPPSDSDSH